MRNLKKILALVLALVMSLSLMTTASAAETTAANDAATLYATAAKVLVGLNVVKGDAENPNDYRPNDDIIRAEAAALIYRVHTGDVEDKQAALHDYAPFDDLAPVQSWATGYISYAQNAGIVKGKSATKFDPLANITGYETLAMTLRALGYGKNGEFEGDQWRQNTAAWAQRNGLFDGISAADQTETRLNQAATRGFVFQVMFNALFKDQMGLSYTTADLYASLGTTMAGKLGLEKLTGVVVANQWANLEGPSVTAEGTTRFLVNGENASRVLSIDTEITDIGESRTAYLKGSKVLDMADSNKNTVKENGGKKTTVADLWGGRGLTGTKHYFNFDEYYTTKDTSEWLIRYVVTVGSGEGAGWKAESWYKENSSWYTYLNDTNKSNVAWTYNKDAEGKNIIAQPLTATVTIRPGVKITDTDMAIMWDIFSSADRYAENPAQGVDNYLLGEVYAGTSSLEDKSDKMSWKDFRETYIDPTATKLTVAGAGNGEWLKIIDNNGDGNAEYVLLTQYDLDKVVDSVTKNDETTYYFYGLDVNDYDIKGLDGYIPAVGDIVLYACIDGTAQMHKVEPVKATFKAVNYKLRQATPTEGDPYEQSDIGNHTRMPETLTDVNEHVEYSLYLDDYGFVRAYENKTAYALVTEVYNTNSLNQGWVNGRDLTAEVLPAGQKAIKEYAVTNSYYYNNNNTYSNPFWTNEERNPIKNDQNKNHLKPATHMLDVAGYQGDEFKYIGSWKPTDDERTWTNVAEYVMGEDGKSISLYSAAKLNGDSEKSQTDYIQLEIQDVSKSDPLYAINDKNYPNTTNAQDNYVRAVDDTIFFAIAADGTIRQWTGYKSSDAVDLKVAANNIHAMYAVATDTAVERDGADKVDARRYWVADVIVIELDAFTWTNDSVSLIYSNNYKVSGDVKYVQAIDSKLGQIGIVPNNVNIWNGQFTLYGFYGLRNVEVVDEAEKIYKADIVCLHTGTGHSEKSCSANKIYYGVVRSLWDEQGRSDYITVDELDANDKVVAASKGIHVVNGAWGINGNTSALYNDAIELTLGGHASNRVVEGDYVIWVETGTSNNAGFVVDLSDKSLNSLHGWYNPGWLETIEAAIAAEQTTDYVGDAYAAAKTALMNARTAALADITDEDGTILDEDLAAAIEAAYNAAVAKLDEIMADTTKTVEEKLAAIETAQTEGEDAIDKATEPEGETWTVTVETELDIEYTVAGASEDDPYTVVVTPVEDEDGELYAEVEITITEPGDYENFKATVVEDEETDVEPQADEEPETLTVTVYGDCTIEITATKKGETATFTLGTKEQGSAQWYWDDPEAPTEKVDIELLDDTYTVGSKIPVDEFINLPELPTGGEDADTDWDIEFLPADAAHYDYETNEIVVDKEGEITVLAKCYNEDWTTEITIGDEDEEPEEDEKYEGGISNKPPVGAERMSRVLARPTPTDLVSFYTDWISNTKTVSSIVYNGTKLTGDNYQLISGKGDYADRFYVKMDVPFSTSGYEFTIWLKKAGTPVTPDEPVAPPELGGDLEQVGDPVVDETKDEAGNVVSTTTTTKFKDETTGLEVEQKVTETKNDDGTVTSITVMTPSTEKELDLTEKTEEDIEDVSEIAEESVAGGTIDVEADYIEAHTIEITGSSKPEITLDDDFDAENYVIVVEEAPEQTLSAETAKAVKWIIRVLLKVTVTVEDNTTTIESEAEGNGLEFSIAFAAQVTKPEEPDKPDTTEAKKALEDAITAAEGKTIPTDLPEENKTAAETALANLQVAIATAKDALTTEDATNESLAAAKTALDEAVAAFDDKMTELGGTTTPDPETIPVVVVDAEGNEMTDWATYITITVDNGEPVKELPKVKVGQLLNITANEVEGKDVKVSPERKTVEDADADAGKVVITVTVTDKAPAEDVEVTVTANKGDAGSLQVLDDKGEYTDKYTATVNGKLTITVKMVPGSKDVKPVIVDAEGKIVEDYEFAKAEAANTWTVTVDVAETTTINVTAKEYFVVTLSKEIGPNGPVAIKFDGEKDDVVTKDVFSGASATFTATIERTDIQPTETTSTGAKISQNDDGKWVITYEKVTKKIDAKFNVTGNIYLTANVGQSRKMVLVDEKLAAGEEVLIKGGVVELVVDATVGTQPVIKNGSSISEYFVPADAETYDTAADGMNRWVLKRTNVTASQNISVSEDAQVKATLSQNGSGVTIPNEYAGASTSTAYVTKTAGKTNGMLVWTATFENVGVYTSSMIELYSTAHPTDSGDKIVTEKTGTDASGRELYKVTFTSREMQSFNSLAGFSVTVKTTPKKQVRLTGDADGYIKVNGLKSDVVGAGEKATKADGTTAVTYAKFTLTVTEGYIPNYTGSATAVRFAPVEGSATNWEAWVVPGESDLTEVDITAKKIPQINVANSLTADVVDTSGVARVVKMAPEVTDVKTKNETSQKDNWDWANGMCPIKFVGEITGIKTTIATTMGVAAVEDVTFTSTPTEDAQEFSIKVSAPSTYAAETIPANLRANVGVKVTISIKTGDETKISLGDLARTQYVKTGGELSFNADLTTAANADDSILTDTGVSALNANGSYTVTVKNVTGDAAGNLTVTLSVGKAKEFKWKIESTTATGIANVPKSAGSGSNNDSFEVLLATGYTLAAANVTVKDSVATGTTYTEADCKVTVQQTAKTDRYTVTVEILKDSITDVTIALAPQENTEVNGWDFMPGRIWNAYDTDAEGKATGTRKTDTHDFSRLYKAGSYTVSGGQLERTADGNYAATVAVNADDIIMHWNGDTVDKTVKGWWTGVCIKVPTGVKYITGIATYNGDESIVKKNPGTTENPVDMYEGSDGKGVTITKDGSGATGYIALYHNAKESGTVTYVLKCYKGSVSAEGNEPNDNDYLYTLNLTVNYTVTVAEEDIPAIPEQEAPSLKDWKFNPGRIWNGWQEITGNDGKVTTGEKQRGDTHVFSKLYTEGTYKVIPDAGGFVKTGDKEYTYKMTVTADGAIMHYNGSAEKSKGWWTGLCITVPNEVDSIKRVKSDSSESDVDFGADLYEGEDGTAVNNTANKEKSFSLYYDGSESKTVTYTLKCYGPVTQEEDATATPMYTIKLVVDYRINKAADQTIPEVSNTAGTLEAQG